MKANKAKTPTKPKIVEIKATAILFKSGFVGPRGLSNFTEAAKAVEAKSAVVIITLIIMAIFFIFLI